MKKRLLALLISLILVATVAVVAFAADSVQMTVTPEKTSAFRGETVTFSVSVSALQDCRSAGLGVEYDRDIFAFVEGNCTLDNVFMSEFDVTNDILNGVLAFAEPAAVSGQIFTFTMKVKEDAAFGSTAISFRPAVRNAAGNLSCLADPVTFTVACDHSWSDWNKADDAIHVRSCPICGAVETASHNWDAGKVTAEPTCAKEGVRVFTCQTCCATSWETVAKTEDHSYSPWIKIDEQTHKHICAVCDKVETGTHVYDLSRWEADADNHWHGCSCGAKQDVGVHSFTEELIDEAHRIPGDGKVVWYYYDCAHCDTVGTESFSRGTLDEDEDVDEDDAIFLLSHILMPEEYPVSQGVDYDGDGQKNESDAIYLLLCILLPDYFSL